VVHDLLTDRSEQQTPKVAKAASSDECIAMLAGSLREHPALWDEDIGR
jgi:hypothetical protein